MIEGSDYGWDGESAKPAGPGSSGLGIGGGGLRVPWCRGRLFSIGLRYWLIRVGPFRMINGLSQFVPGPFES
jgi:hypothetical protein